MRFDSWDNYIDTMLSQVKFRFDHREIRQEYEEHMEDKLEFLMDCGMDEESAAREILREMGEPKSLGQALNSIHNPLLGWIWWVTTRLTAVVVSIFVLVMMWTVVIPGALGVIQVHPPDRAQEERLTDRHGEIVFQHELDEKRHLDNSWMHVKEIRRYEDGTVLMVYKKNGRLVGGRTGGGDIGINMFLRDEKGNFPESVGGGGNGGAFIRKSYAEISGLPDEAEYLILDYKTVSGQVYIKMPLCEEAVQQ